MFQKVTPGGEFFSILLEGSPVIRSHLLCAVFANWWNPPILEYANIFSFNNLRLVLGVPSRIARTDAKNSQERERGGRLHHKRPDRRRAHCGVGSAHRGRRKRPPYHPGPERYDFNR